MIENFIISIDILCHFYFLIVHMLSIFAMTSVELDQFQKSNGNYVNFVKYFSQIVHFAFVLVFSVSNGIRCSKYFSKIETDFCGNYWNFIRGKFTRFAKIYYFFILLYTFLVNYIIKDEAKNEKLNKNCIETIPYKILFLSNFHQKYVKFFLKKNACAQIIPNLIAFNKKLKQFLMDKEHPLLIIN